MRRRSLILILLLISSFSMLLSPVFGGVFGEVLLVDDATFEDDGSNLGKYEFVTLSENPVAFGVRSHNENGFDIGTFEDNGLQNMIESSGSSGKDVNFVVVDDDTLTGPKNLWAHIQSNQGEYTVEMENEIDCYPASTSWVGHMDIPEGLVLNVGLPGSLDDEGVYGPTVVHVDDVYHMWYTINDGSLEKIGYATSTNGIFWEKHPHHVLTVSADWDRDGVSHPSVYFDGNEFHMWYTGSDGTTTRIGYAYSDNGIDWIKHIRNPVLRDIGGSWDGSGVSEPSVLHDGSIYHMWYTDFNGTNYRIGHAVSSNEVDWTRDENPVLNPNLGRIPFYTWDWKNSFSPSVILEGGTFHMLFAGNGGDDTRIGYAKSDDGIIWEKDKRNPIIDLGPTGSWDDTEVTHPAWIRDGSIYHMWYTGNDGNNLRVGLALSDNMWMWAKHESSPEVIDTHLVTGITESLPYTIELDVPSGVDLDMFLLTGTGGRDDALASSINRGAGLDESITFTAPTSGDYILVITNENGGTGMYTVIPKSPPIPNILGNLVADRNGSVIFRADAIYPILTEEAELHPGRRSTISGDGSYFVVGWASCISFFSIESRIPLWTIDLNDFVWELRLSNNGEYLAALTYKTMYFFHTSTNIPLWSVDLGYGSGLSPGSRMDLSCDGRFISSKAWGNRVLVFDTKSPTPSIPYWEYDFGDDVLITRISGDGRYMAIGGAHEHEFRLGFIPEKRIEWTYISNDIFYSSSISYNGSTISFGQGMQHNVGVFDSTSGNPAWIYDLNGTQYKQAMSNKGDYFVSTNAVDIEGDSWTGFVLWDTEHPQPIWEYRISEELLFFAETVDMDDEGIYVVGGCPGGKIYLFSQLADENPGWHKEDGTPIFTFLTGGEINSNSVSISEDGSYFVVGSHDGSVYLFSTEGEPHLVRSWNPESIVPASGEYSWDFDASVDSDKDGDFTNDKEFIGSDPTHVYKKNGNYTVTLTLTTDEGTVHTYTMFVTVNIFEEEESIVEKLMKPGLPLAGIALMVGLILSLFVGKTEVGNYKLIPIIFPLYSRLRKNELLDQDTRSQIYRYIMENPGDNYNSIRESLNLNNGTLAYHLKTLERENYIKSMRDGRFKRFYPVETKVQRVNGFGTGSVQGRIMVYLMGNPGLSQREIAGALGLSQQVVSYHLKLLLETGHVRIRREGKKYRYYTNEWIPQHEM